MMSSPLEVERKEACETYNKILKYLSDIGIEYKNFYFKGTIVGHKSLFPRVVDTYEHYGYGQLVEYDRGQRRVGEWIVVWERCIPPTIWDPSEFYAIYIRESDLPRLKKELKKKWWT